MQPFLQWLAETIIRLDLVRENGVATLFRAVENV